MLFLYNVLIYPLIFILFWILSFFSPKVREGFLLRKNKGWLKPLPQSHSANSAPLIWFHVASGEFEYAKPVITELKKTNPEILILVTYFSPSVVGSLKKYAGVDIFVPMPWDTPWHWKAFLGHYKPRCLAIARTDAWPNMVWQTQKHKIPSLLFSATLTRHSGRVSSLFGRLFFAEVYESLSEISCVTEEDVINFQTISPDIFLTQDGDTRFDQVVARQKNGHAGFSLKSGVFTDSLPELFFVAGSTWSEDEQVLLPVLKKLKGRVVSLIAPHEPTPAHLESLEAQISKLGLQSQRLSKLKEGNATSDLDIILVDTVGILADLYKLGDIAFVGGSFKRSVHSVMEPAASGCFTFVGPFHHNNREISELIKMDFAQALHSQEEVESFFISELALTPENRSKRKEKILGYVLKKTGVSRVIARKIIGTGPVDC